MKRIHSAITLVIVSLVAFMATPRGSAVLQAQVPPCTCTFIPNTIGTGPNTFACLGTADMNLLTCTSFGRQCFISGYATWTADPPATNCAYNLGTAGWIRATASGQGGPSYFNPTITNTIPGIPVGVLSANCASMNAFGALMEVAHQPFTTSPCNCLGGTATSTPVAYLFYTCQ